MDPQRLQGSESEGEGSSANLHSNAPRPATLAAVDPPHQAQPTAAAMTTAGALLSNESDEEDIYDVSPRASWQKHLGVPAVASLQPQSGAPGIANSNFPVGNGQVQSMTPSLTTGAASTARDHTPLLVPGLSPKQTPDCDVPGPSIHSNKIVPWKDPVSYQQLGETGPLTTVDIETHDYKGKNIMDCSSADRNGHVPLTAAEEWKAMLAKKRAAEAMENWAAPKRQRQNADSLDLDRMDPDQRTSMDSDMPNVMRNINAFADMRVMLESELSDDADEDEDTNYGSTPSASSNRAGKQASRDASYNPYSKSARAAAAAAAPTPDEEPENPGEWSEENGKPRYVAKKPIIFKPAAEDAGTWVPPAGWKVSRHESPEAPPAPNANPNAPFSRPSYGNRTHHQPSPFGRIELPRAEPFPPSNQWTKADSKRLEDMAEKPVMSKYVEHQEAKLTVMEIKRLEKIRELEMMDRAMEVAEREYVRTRVPGARGGDGGSDEEESDGESGDEGEDEDGGEESEFQEVGTEDEVEEDKFDESESELPPMQEDFEFSQSESEHSSVQPPPPTQQEYATANAAELIPPPKRRQNYRGGKKKSGGKQ